MLHFQQRGINDRTRNQVPRGRRDKKYRIKNSEIKRKHETFTKVINQIFSDEWSYYNEDSFYGLWFSQGNDKLCKCIASTTLIQKEWFEISDKSNKIFTLFGCNIQLYSNVWMRPCTVSAVSELLICIQSAIINVLVSLKQQKGLVVLVWMREIVQSLKRSLIVSF